MPKPMPRAAQFKQGSDGAELLYRLRVTYSQLGRCAMLSHLEVARYVERVVRRAGLPYAISHGFSPHMRIAFGSALPVGVGGTAEIFDVFLTEQVSPSKALSALQKSCVPDMMVIDCAYIDRRATAASVAYPFSLYRIRANTALHSLVLPDTITVMRKKKERTLIVDEYVWQKPMIDPLDTTCFTVGLEAKSTGSLRPDVLVTHLAHGFDWRPIEMMRIESYDQAPHS